MISISDFNFSDDDLQEFSNIFYRNYRVRLNKCESELFAKELLGFYLLLINYQLDIIDSNF